MLLEAGSEGTSVGLICTGQKAPQPGCFPKLHLQGERDGEMFSQNATGNCVGEERIADVPINISGICTTGL